METPLAALQACLDRAAPRTLLYLTRDEPLAFAAGDCVVSVRTDVDSVAALAGDGRHDVALVANLLEHLPVEDGRALLGRLRNLHAARVFVFVADDGTRWTLDDFVALGFRREASFSDGSRTLALYSYDIATYNHVRDWNNPRFWANPQMWGKYFW